MAIELGAAYISILPSTSKLAPEIRKELKEAEGDAKRSGDASGEKFGSGFKSKMGAILKGGVLAGIGGISLLGGLGVKTAADMEQANIAFTTMLGSADKAKSFIAELSDFAAKTPFDFPGLQTAATSLISAGIATRDVLPIMETLGNVTSGMGTGAEGIQRATIALQQMTAAGRITGEDLNQLRDAGIPVFDLLAASTGKSKAEIVKLAQAGKLGSKELGQLMEGLKTGKGLERFNGLMEKQAVSLTGMWSTFQDTLGMGMAKAVTPLIPLLKNGLAGATKALEPALVGVATALKETIEFTIAVVKWGQQHKTLLSVLTSVVGTLAAGVLAYNAYVKVTTAITKGWAIAQGLLNAAMALNPIGLVIAAIVVLGIALVLAWKKSETFRKIVTGAFDKVKAGARIVANFFTRDIPRAFDKIREAAGKVLSWITTRWDALVGFVKGLPRRVSTAASGLFDSIKTGARKAREWVEEKFDKLVGFFRDLPGRFSTAASGMFDGIKSAFRSAINFVIRKWNGLNLSLSLPKALGGGSVGIGTPDIPEFAEGGVVSKTTLGIFGEAGTEAVMPLDRLGDFLDKAYLAGANSEGRRFASSADKPVYTAPTRPAEITVIGDTNPDLTAARVARRLSMLGA